MANENRTTPQTGAQRADEGAGEDTVRVGTRGSALALWQTENVIALLQARHPAARFAVQTIKTQGDKTQALAIPMTQLGDKGMFVAELEQALLAGYLDIAVEPLHDRLLVERERQPIDAAVHSLKDLPGQLAAGLTLAAITERADARDVWFRVMAACWTIFRGARAWRPAACAAGRSFCIEGPTSRLLRYVAILIPCLRKALAPDGPDAVILAAAGLERLGLAEYITEDSAAGGVPAAGAGGALAVEVRAADEQLVLLVAAADHAPTRRAVSAERALLDALGGGCQVPIGVYASVEGAESSNISGCARWLPARMACACCAARRVGR